MPVRSKIRRREALAFCFVSLASPSFAAGPRVHRIVIDKLAFVPAPGGLHVNDIVEWSNSDILRHTATTTNGSFDIDLPATPANLIKSDRARCKISPSPASFKGKGLSQ
jgi:plastocyanin